MIARTSAAGLLGLLLAALSAGPSAAQYPPPQPVPTAAQAQAADTRQGQYVDVDGARIFYQVAGTGTPLLLIHGFPLDGQLYQGQLAQLSQVFKVITPDLRGFGKSSIPDAQASIQLYAQDMLALMDRLGVSKAIIGGHSMGGQIVLQMYRQAPGRFLGMILIDTNPMAASIVEQAEFPAFGAQAQQQGVPSIVPTLAAQFLTGVARLNDRAATLTLMNIIAEASVNGVVAGGQALATRPDFTALLPRIAVPALVLVGVDDPVYGLEISQMTQAAVPGSTLTIIRQAEHTSIFEQAVFANTAIARWSAQRGLR